MPAVGGGAGRRSTQPFRSRQSRLHHDARWLREAGVAWEEGRERHTRLQQMQPKISGAGRGGYWVPGRGSCASSPAANFKRAPLGLDEAGTSSDYRPVPGRSGQVLARGPQGLAPSLPGALLHALLAPGPASAGTFLRLPVRLSSLAAGMGQDEKGAP